MSVPFEIPDWLTPADDPPTSDTCAVDPYRVEDLLNRFIAAKQDALLTDPDASCSTAGAGTERPLLQFHLGLIIGRALP